MKTQKENLVLIHSFPTNSILLKGLIEYLQDYFNVYFIDLPGFTKEVPPLSKISFAEYSRFAEDKITEFNLGSYLVGGISFGFTIINNIQYDNKCKGIIAMEPYIGPGSLRMGLFQGLLYNTLTKGIFSLNLSSIVWESNIFRKYLHKLGNFPPSAIDITLDQVDGRTFFETAYLIFSHKDGGQFQDLPYVLMANKDDQTVNYDYIYKTFTENVKKLLVVDTTIEHYPAEITKAYFKEKIIEEDIQKILSFVSHNNNP
jgi:pimeloyl-ACP methyl ester carboxylesterase